MSVAIQLTNLLHSNRFNQLHDPKCVPSTEVTQSSEMKRRIFELEQKLKFHQVNHKVIAPIVPHSRRPTFFCDVQQLPFGEATNGKQNPSCQTQTNEIKVKLYGDCTDGSAVSVDEHEHEHRSTRSNLCGNLPFGPMNTRSGQTTVVPVNTVDGHKCVHTHFEPNYNPRAVVEAEDPPASDRRCSERAPQTKQQLLTQHKVSHLLREFYHCWSDKELRSARFSRFRTEIVFANKCLLVSGKVETNSVRQQQSKNDRACLALRSVSLPLRRSSSNIYLFSLIEAQSSNQHKWVESIVLNSSTHRVDNRCFNGKSGSHVVFEFNELFDNLDLNFKLVVTFYQLDFSSNLDDSLFHHLLNTLKKSKIINFTKDTFYEYISRRITFLKRKSLKLPMVTSMETNSDNHFKVIKVHETTGMVNVPLVTTAFKPIGSLELNRGNWTMATQMLDQFDCTWSVCGDRAMVDCDLSVQYDSTELVNGIFGVLIQTRTLNTVNFCDVLSKSHLGDGYSKKFGFIKCSLTFDDQYLNVRSQNTSTEFNLAQCVNSHVDTMSNASGTSNVRGKFYMICLVFGKSLWLPPLKTKTSFHSKTCKFQFVFITATNKEQLDQFYSRVQNRLKAIHRWQTLI